MATLLATWIFGIAPPSMRTLANVSLIVLGVVIASFGEIKFDLIGFISMPPKDFTLMWCGIY